MQEEYDGPPDGVVRPEDLVQPEDFLPQRPMPHDARRLGLDRNTEQGALIALAASLDPAKPLHRAVAWILLVAFALPVLGAVAHIF